MKWTSMLAIYFLLWFFALFLVLPFHGRRSTDQDEVVIPGQERGAPVSIRPWRIILQVTLLALVLFGIYYAIYSSGIVTLGTIQAPD